MALCPLIHKKCIKDKCAWWMTFIMRDVKSQELSPQSNCAIVWLPDILREQNKNTIGVAAAVENRGNEMVKTQQLTNNIFSGMAKMVAQAKARKRVGNGRAT